MRSKSELRLTRWRGRLPTFPIGVRLMTLPAAFVCSAIANLPAFAISQDDLQFIQTQIDLNSLGRYMSPEGKCHPAARVGWEKFPVQSCIYDGGGVDLPVMLLNPDKQQLARWLTSACADAGAANIRHCAERLALVNTCQSGSQFPVAGFVYEGPILVFRDGVTSVIEGVGKTTVSAAKVSKLKKSVFDNEPVTAKKFARISSTTRDDFAAFAGVPSSSLDNLAWLDTVRREYQAAWGRDANRLMTARVNASLSNFDKPGWGADFDSFCINVAGCPAMKSKPEICAKKWKAWPSE
jgi:hypothetical protein